MMRLAKRKKYPKLPNGFGCIKHLSGSRRNPYAVYPPSKGVTINGSPILPPAICYTDSWYKGFAVLTAYHAGTYQIGMEDELSLGEDLGEVRSMDQLISGMLSNYSRITQKITGRVNLNLKFSDVYEEFYAWKFDPKREKQLSRSNRYQIRMSYNKSAKLHDMVFANIRTADLQAVMDDLTDSYSTKEVLKIFFNQLYKYAVMRDYIDKDYAKFVEIKTPDDTESGIPFTEQEIGILWKHRDDPIIEFAVIMCFTGHRISEYHKVTVDLDQGIIVGGIKSKAGKNKIVPIHHIILPLVTRRIKEYGCLLPQSVYMYRTKFKKALDELKIVSVPHHTPHDCRHTFSYLCKHYKVDELDRKKLMGHSFGNDITNSVYGHWSIEDLRNAIEKIEAPYCH